MLDLKLKTSHTLVFLLAMAHLLSLALVWLLPLPLAMQIFVSLMLGAHFLFYLQRDCLLAAHNSICHLRLDSKCQCSYQTRDGAWHEASLLGSSTVTPWLSVLNLSTGQAWRARHIALFPDSSDLESLRKLRVLLRWKCGDVTRA